MIPRFALSFSHTMQVGSERVKVYKWVPISPEQAIRGQIVSPELPDHPVNQQVTFLALGIETPTTLVSLGQGNYRELAPGE